MWDRGRGVKQVLRGYRQELRDRFHIDVKKRRGRSKRSGCLRSSRRGAKVQTEFTGPARDTGGGGGTHTMEEQQRMLKADMKGFLHLRSFL